MLKPTADNVILKIIERVDAFADSVKARSGLVVDTETIKQDEPDRGVVYAIGPDVPADAAYRVGDTVIFHTKEIFQGFMLDGNKLVRVKHHEIMAKLAEGAV